MLNGLVCNDGWNIVEMEAACEVVGPRRQPADHNEDQSGRQDKQVIPWSLGSRCNLTIISAAAGTAQRTRARQYRITIGSDSGSGSESGRSRLAARSPGAS